MGLLPVVSEADLNVDHALLGGKRAAHKVLFSFLGIFFKDSFKNPKGGHNIENSVRAPLPLMGLRLKILF